MKFASTGGIRAMATIYITKGPHDGDAYTINDETIVFGRGDECGVKLDDERTSRAHLQITFDPSSSRHSAEDLRSTNGTWHNGKSITSPIELSDGDIISLGNTTIEYCEQTYSSNDAAKAARTANMVGGQPTLIDNANKPF